MSRQSSNSISRLENMGDMISLIVTVFNEEHYIEQMLDSYLSQSYSNLEIIIVNDGSTDNTKNIVDSYENLHSNIKVISFPINRGKVEAQNAGFKISTGKYIAISGGDDFACYSRIKTQLDYLKGHNLDFVSSNLYMIDSDNNCLINNPIFYHTPPTPYTLEQVLLGRGYPGGTIFFSRDLAEKIYPIPSHLPYEDLWFNFIAVIHGKIGYIHEPLGFYRQTGKNSFGLFGSQPYNKFKEKYYYLNRRVLIYLEEMRKYLIESHIWDSAIESYFNYSKQKFELTSGDTTYTSHIGKYINFMFSKKQHLQLTDYLLLIPQAKIFLLYAIRIMKI